MPPVLHLPEVGSRLADLGSKTPPSCSSNNKVAPSEVLHGRPPEGLLSAIVRTRQDVDLGDLTLTKRYE